MYKRKTQDEWQIWTNYGYGLEHETTESTRQDAIRCKKEYINNAHQLTDIRIIKKRVKLEENLK